MAGRPKILTPDTYSRRVAIRLRHLRQKAGLDASIMGERLSYLGYPLAAPTFKAWECGQSRVALDAVPYIAAAFGIPISEFWPET